MNKGQGALEYLLLVGGAVVVGVVVIMLLVNWLPANVQAEKMCFEKGYTNGRMYYDYVKCWKEVCEERCIDDYCKEFCETESFDYQFRVVN